MEILLSSLALAVAILSIWVASTASQKSESALTAFLQTVRKEVTRAKADLEARVVDLEQRIDAIEKSADQTISRAKRTDQAISTMNSELSAIKTELEALDESIPDKFKILRPNRQQSQQIQ